MALIFALTLLALQLVSSASLPLDAVGTPESSSGTPAQGADGRMEADDEPVALLVGKDVKRIIMRKGPSDANQKVFRRRGQNKDFSHHTGSQEWSPKSGLDHILDPVSFEDPQDVELRKAIAQLIKEVADREERRKHKSSLNLNAGDLKVVDDDVNEKSQSKSEDHLVVDKLPELTDDYIDETILKIDNNHNAVSDTVDDFDDFDHRSGSGDEDGDLDLSDDDFESMENDYDYIEDRVHNAKNDYKKVLHDDDQSEQYSKEQLKYNDDLQDKINDYSNHHRHVSKEETEVKAGSNNVKKNKGHLDHIENITLEKSQVEVSKDKLERSDDNHETRNEYNEDRSQKPTNSEHRDYDLEKSIFNKHQNIYVQIPQEHDSSYSNVDVIKTEVLKDLKNSNYHDGDKIGTNQKENEKHKDLINGNDDEKIMDEQNHGEDKMNYDLDKTEDHSSYDSTSNQQYSFENNDTVNRNSENSEQHPNNQEPHDILVDESSKDLVTSNRRNNIDSQNPEIENDNNQNDHNTKLEKSTEDKNEKQIEDNHEKVFSSELKTHVTDAVKDPQSNDDNGVHGLNIKVDQINDEKDQEYDSVEITRYHRLPKRRYPSRDLKRDRISKSFRKSSNRPIKQYTLSFFLRK